MKRNIPDLSHWVSPGRVLVVRARPGARRAAVEPGDDPFAPIRVAVPQKPHEGAANEAIGRLLAEALGIAPSRLTLIKGAASRDKVFRVD